jgi:hypothetical protein
VASAAGSIVTKSGIFDQKRAFLSGLFHDIGKFFVSETEKYKHPRIGYEIFKDSHKELAKICISHPFPVFDNFEYIKYYCHDDTEEAEKIIEILNRIEEDDFYIQLIQYCDKITGIDRYMTIEEKFNWYVKKNGLIPPEIIRPNFDKLPEMIRRNFDKLKELESQFGDLIDYTRVI